MGKKKKKPQVSKKVIAQRAKWMRRGAQTFHEGAAKYVMKDICEQLSMKLKNQKIFRDDKNKKWYIADFFIEKKGLVIEIDGPSHQTESQKIYDKNRTEFIESLGHKVARFDNMEVQSLEFRGKVERLLNSMPDLVLESKKSKRRKRKKREKLLEVEMKKISRRKRGIRYLAKNESKIIKPTREEIEQMTQQFLMSGGKIKTIAMQDSQG